jgi:hypothetical protein
MGCRESSTFLDSNLQFDRGNLLVSHYYYSTANW